MIETVDVLTGIVPVVLIVAFILLVVRMMTDGKTGMVDRMKQAVGGVVMLLVALMVVFAFTGGGGDPGPGPDPDPDPDPELYDVHFYVATDSAGYGTVSISSLSDVPEGTSVTVAQTLTVGSAGQCTATPAAATSEYTYAFSGWTGADDSSTPAPATITGDAAFYAHFTRTTQEYTVSFAVATDSQGYGTVSPASIAGVPYGASVTAAQTLAVGSAGQCTATPAADTSEYTYDFDKWTGADDAATAVPAAITRDVTLYAHFTRTPVGPLPMDPSLFTFTVSGGNATVTGWAGSEPAAGYDLVFPETDGQGHPVTAVQGDDYDASYVSAFAGAKSVASSTITNVNPRAFKSASMQSVSLPAVSYIGTSAFEGCTSLASVSLPATNIRNNAFKGCTSLASVDISGDAAYNTGAFEGCTGVTSVSFAGISNIYGTPFPDWTFYDTDGETILNKTPANLANSTFEGVYNALVKVDPNRGLTTEMQQRVLELSAENTLKASMLAEIDPELADMDPSDVARMTVSEIRALTADDVMAIKSSLLSQSD